MYQAISARRTLIMYDARGTGLSDRKPDFSLHARLNDLGAVIEASGFDQVDLAAATLEAGVAAAYAAQHPERVRKLVLLDPVARGRDYMQQPAIRALSSYREMLDEDWDGYLATLSARIVGFEHTDRARALAGVMAEASSPASIRAHVRQLEDFDSSEWLPQVTCPTLILMFPQQTASFPHLAEEFAATIPGARSVTIAWPHRFPLGPEAIAVMEAFLEEPGPGS
jgi:pimeloyl-ACP methyl ester carboxylesterase